MYSHREPKSRVEVVDLDPYGTAAPFTDAALGCISDGGELQAYLCILTAHRPFMCDLYRCGSFGWIAIS